MSEEEYQKQMQAKAAKEGKNLNFTRSGQDNDIPRLSPERQRNYNQPFNTPSAKPSTQPPVQKEPEKPKAPAVPPDRFRTFVPLETSNPKEPEKPAPKTPPDRFRTFIPPAT
jgi:hypothetical protein